MVWKIETEEEAEKQLDKLDPQIARRILKFLHQRIAPIDNPRSIGEALSGTLGDFWKYRVGDYRIICDIQDTKIAILVLAIGNRKQVYRRK